MKSWRRNNPLLLGEGWDPILSVLWNEGRETQGANAKEGTQQGVAGQSNAAAEGRRLFHT